MNMFCKEVIAAPSERVFSGMSRVKLLSVALNHVELGLRIAFLALRQRFVTEIMARTNAQRKLWAY